MKRSPAEKLRIIVTGYLAQYPLGGVAWDYVQYAVGLHRLGHDVYYLEDTHLWPYSPTTGGVAKDCTENVAYLAAIMERFGLGDRWAYRFPWESQWFGLSEARRKEVLETADCLINVSGSLGKPLDYRDIPRLAYIDSDPVFTQIKLAKQQAELVKAVDGHDVHFSFGECHSDHVPDTGHTWLPTRQPVVLDEWRHQNEARETFTTIMNWTSYKDLDYEGKTFGQKDREFARFMNLPERVAPTPIEIAVNAGKTRRTPKQMLERHGWRIADPDQVCPDLDSYRDYIQRSKAEWSVAKHGYVAGQSGWFSCRSACYLAASRPVVVQDTGFGAILPVGEGILSFRDLDEAVQAVTEVVTNYPRHARAAGEVATEYFDSGKVLTRLLDQLMSGTSAAGPVACTAEGGGTGDMSGDCNHPNLTSA
jgi:hypothetical protein